MRELSILLGDNPIASDFEEVYECIIDNVSYPSVLLDIIEEGVALAAKEEDVSIQYRGYDTRSWMGFIRFLQYHE